LAKINKDVITLFRKNFSDLISAIKEKGHRTAISAVSYGSASVITQALMMVYLIIVAEWLGAEQYGYIAAAHAATSLSAFFFTWGFNEWMIKEGSTSSNVELLGGRVVFAKFILGIIWGFILYFSLRLIRPGLYLSYILYFSLLEVWLDSTFGTLLIIPLLKDRIRLASVLLISSRLLRLLALIVLINFGPRSIFHVLLLRLLTTLFIFLITWVLTRPILRGIKSVKLGTLFKDSYAFNTGELLNLIYMHADVNILVWLGGDSALIANYSIVISLINTIITLPSGIYNVLLPALVRTYNTCKDRFIQQVSLVYIGLISLGLIFWISAAKLSRPLILMLLGESYIGSIDLLILLSPLLALRTFNQANIAYLVSVGWQARRLLPQFFMVIIKLGVGIYAVSQFQSIGMVIVTIGTEGLLFLAYLVQIFRHYFETKPIKTI
jgi:O-antigen/teichoic acid export membrane protein